MSRKAASSAGRRARRPLLLGAAFLAAGAVFAVASACWIGVNESSAYLTAFRQQSLIARRGNQKFDCVRQEAWGVTQWETSTASVDPAAATADIPAWVATPSRIGDIFETDSFGWPARALYRHRYLSRAPSALTFTVTTSDSYEVVRGRGEVWRFPLGPVWIGLGIDAAFWAALLGLTWMGVLCLKRFAADRKGLCLSCGYDRRGLGRAAACPECGAPPRAREPSPAASLTPSLPGPSS